jgi:hypothetical protein
VARGGGEAQGDWPAAPGSAHFYALNGFLDDTAQQIEEHAEPK